MRDWYGDPGLGGYTDSFNFLDLGTGWKHSEPTKSNDTDEIHLCLAFIAGNERIKLIYCDGAPAYKSACKRMQILSEKAQPGIHQTNARIERCNADILAGSKVLLVQAGLPSCFWPYVTACYCFLENVTEVDCESSPWFLRHGAHFMGLALPPGCRVWFGCVGDQPLAKCRALRLPWLASLAGRWPVSASLPRCLPTGFILFPRSHRCQPRDHGHTCPCPSYRFHHVPRIRRRGWVRMESETRS